MDRSVRTLLRVEIAEGELSLTTEVVEQLMGNKPESRFPFIQDRAEFAKPDELDI
jgi:topoisomerase-4 subunit B